MLFTRVATSEKSPEILSSGAGLGAAVAAETHGELGEVEGQVRARGYWEQVWRRFRRDKAAIAGGLFIIFLFLMAFVGGPIAAHLLGHGPNDNFTGSAVRNFLPVGPWTHVISSDGGYCTGAQCHHTLLILGADSTLGREE